MWSGRETTKKELGLSVTLRGSKGSKSTTAIIKPSIGSEGYRGLWFIYENLSAFYPLQRRVTEGTGLSYTYEAKEFESVLAVTDVLWAEKIHLFYRNTYGTGAPVVVYNSMTSASDWSMLSGKRVVIYSSDSVYAPPTESIMAAFQADLDVRFGETPLAHSDRELDLSTGGWISGMVSSGIDFLQLFRGMPEKDKKETTKVLVNTDHFNLLNHIAGIHGPAAAQELGLGYLKVPNSTIMYRGYTIEESDDGYVISKKHSSAEKISNFTMRFKKLLRYCDSDRCAYVCEVKMEGKSFSFIQDTHTKKPTVEAALNELRRSFIDAGVKEAIYLRRDWVTSLHDIAMLFDPPESEFVIGQPGYDEASGMFMFPGYKLDTHGKLRSTGGYCLERCALQWDGSLTVSDLETILSQAEGVLSGAVPYIVSCLLFDGGLLDTPPPALISVNPNKSPGIVMDRIIKGGIKGLRNIKSADVVCRGRKTVNDLNSTIAETSQSLNYLLGAKFDTIKIMNTPIPSLVSTKHMRTIENAVSGLIIQTLQYCLQSSSEITSLDSVFKLYSKFMLESYRIKIGHGTISRPECLQRCVTDRKIKNKGLLAKNMVIAHVFMSDAELDSLQWDGIIKSAGSRSAAAAR
jgi:hypothetical protein